MTKSEFLSNKISLKLKGAKMKIEIAPSEQTIKQKNYIVAELWTKMKTIRDDKSTPLVYSQWCDQMMQFLGIFSDDE